MKNDNIAETEMQQKKTKIKRNIFKMNETSIFLLLLLLLFETEINKL